MDKKEQPILGIVATINGSEITEGANQLINNVKRIEAASEGAARSITKTFSTLQLQLAQVNEQIKVAEERLRTLGQKAQPEAKTSDTSNDARIVELQRQMNRLLQERTELIKRLAQQEKQTTTVGGGKGGGSSKQKVGELLRQQRELSKELKKSLDERVRLEGQLTDLYKQQENSKGNADKIQEWQAAIAKQKEYIANLGEIKQKITDTGEVIELYPAGWEAANDQLNKMEAHLARLQGEDPLSAQIAAVERQMDAVYSDIDSITEKIEGTKTAIEEANAEAEESKKKAETMTKRLRDIREEMRRMKMEGKDSTPEYGEMAEEAKKLQAAINSANEDANAQTPILSKMTGGVRRYKDMLSALPAPIKASVEQMNQLIMTSLRFLATPLGAVVGALVLAFKALSSWFTNTSEGQKTWASISGYCEGVVDSLTKRVYRLIDSLRGVKDAVPTNEELSGEQKTDEQRLKERAVRPEWAYKRENELKEIQQRAKSQMVLYNEIKHGRSPMPMGMDMDEVMKHLLEYSQEFSDAQMAITNIQRESGTWWQKTKIWFSDITVSAIRETKSFIDSTKEAAEAMSAFNVAMIDLKERIENQKLLDAATDAQIARLQSQQNSPTATTAQQMGLSRQISDLQQKKMLGNKANVQDEINAILSLAGGKQIPTSVLDPTNGVFDEGALEKYGIKGENLDRLRELYKDLIGLESDLASNTANTNNQLTQQQMELVAARQRYIDDMLSTDLQLSKEEADIIYEKDKMILNALADSMDKRVRLREMEHSRNLLLIEREKEESIRAAREAAMSEFNSNPNLGKRSWNDSLLSIEYGSAQYNALNAHDKGVLDNYLRRVGIANAKADASTASENADYLGVNELLEKYQNFQMKRIALDTEYQLEREKVTEAIKAQEEILNSEVASASQKSNAEVLKNRLTASKDEIEQEYKLRKEALAAEQLQQETKNDRLYKMASGDLIGLNADTLKLLTARLNELKEIPNLSEQDIEALQHLVDTINDKLVVNSPLERLVKAQDELNTLRGKEVALTKAISSAKANGSSTVTVGEKTYTLDEAVTELAGIALGIQKQTQIEEEAFSKMTTNLSQIFQSVQNIGEQIGGTVGSVISSVGMMGSTYLGGYTRIKDIQKGVADGSIGKGTGNAMSVMAGIEAGMQIGSTLTNLLSQTGVTGADKYERYAKRIKEQNELTDSVNRYRLAVLKAQNAESNWFGNDALGSLSDKWMEGSKALSNYYAKLNEQQARYRNQSRMDGDWLGSVIVDTLAGAAIGLAVGGPLGALIGGAAGGATGALQAFGGQALFNGSYDRNRVSAIDNLRIETRSRKKSFMGIGGHDQRTADLRQWAREQYGSDLFDSAGLIDVNMATEIIDSYGDKLMGETRQTLEELIDLRRTYDEYIDSLKEHVNSLFSPIAQAMTDAIWEWYDNGVDALYSFQQKASEVFRNIASDIVNTIVMKKIFGTFEDDIVDMYDRFLSGQISSQQLITDVAQRTQGVMNDYETQIPVLENLLTSMDNTFQSVTGIGFSKGGSSAGNATMVGQSATHEDLDQANGRLTALQIGQQQMIVTQTTMLSQLYLLTDSHTSIRSNVGLMRGDVSALRDMMFDSTEYLRRIEANTARLNGMAVNIENINRKIMSL